jgi:hypothetical protein
LTHGVSKTQALTRFIAQIPKPTASTHQALKEAPDRLIQADLADLAKVG